MSVVPLYLWQASAHATLAEWVLFDAQRLRRLHKRAAADANSGTHASAVALREAGKTDMRPSPALPWPTHSPSLHAQIFAQ